ncbi:hypothetical protein Z042_09620 [Chania multitudinisentens RB-25]|uniref:Uncharacterized protein n=1 Tax=Chania multitudinisentens RB-25 TaxID=1441930 RepID=W0LFU2_9GAMM|nr:hypothetical protein Z042_09620 [Chania multitudinisentens RB-25]
MTVDEIRWYQQGAIEQRTLANRRQQRDNYSTLLPVSAPRLGRWRKAKSIINGVWRVWSLPFLHEMLAAKAGE